MKLLLSFLLAVCFTSGAVAQILPQRGPAPKIGHRDPAVNLAMGQWRFVSIGKKQVVPLRRQPPYIKLESRNHTVTGSTGCNRLRGTYRAGDSSLAFRNVVSTRVACTAESYDREILEILRSTTGFKIADHELHLLGKSGVLAILIRPHQEQTAAPKRAEQ